MNGGNSLSTLMGPAPSMVWSNGEGISEDGASSLIAITFFWHFDALTFAEGLPLYPFML